jgi:hypothetical protein
MYILGHLRPKKEPRCLCDCSSPKLSFSAVCQFFCHFCSLGSCKIAVLPYSGGVPFMLCRFPGTLIAFLEKHSSLNHEGILEKL